MDNWVVVLENRWLLIYCNSQFNFLLSDTYFVVFVSAVWLIFSPWKRRVHLIIKNIFSWMRPLHLVTDLLEMRLNNYGFLLLKKQTTANRNTPERHSRILLILLTVYFLRFHCASGEPPADAGRRERELSHRSPQQRTSAVRPVPPRPPGNRLPPFGVWGQCRCSVWKRHESPLLLCRGWTHGPGHTAMQAWGQGERITWWINKSRSV